MLGNLEEKGWTRESQRPQPGCPAKFLDTQIRRAGPARNTAALQEATALLHSSACCTESSSYAQLSNCTRTLLCTHTFCSPGSKAAQLRPHAHPRHTHTHTIGLPHPNEALCSCSTALQQWLRMPAKAVTPSQDRLEKFVLQDNSFLPYGPVGISKTQEKA